MKQATVATNYFTQQLTELHLTHVGQITQLNTALESRDHTIGSLERTIDDQSGTISKLRSQLIELDKQLQSRNAPTEAAAASKVEGTVKAEAVKEQSDDSKNQCDCPLCVIRRSIEGAETEKAEEPGEEMPEGLRYFLKRMQSLGEDVSVMSAGTAAFDKEETDNLKALAEWLKVNVNDVNLQHSLENPAASLAALEKITSKF